MTSTVCFLRGEHARGLVVAQECRSAWGVRSLHGLIGAVDFGWAGRGGQGD